METLEDRTVPSFMYPAQYLSNPANNNYISPVAAADFNGDGQLDLAVVGPGGRDAYLGNGDGTFQSAITSPPFGETYWEGKLRAADFNGDGRDDLVMSHGFASLSNGDGTFQDWVSSANVLYATDVAAGDLDGNGTVDLVFSGFGTDYYAMTGSVTVVKGNGDGTFTQPESYSAGDYPTSVTLADFNNDGALDVAVGDSGYDFAAAVLMGNGNGTFANAEYIFEDSWAPYSLYSEPQATRVAAADFNLDGHIDLALNAEYSSTQILLGNGDGSFQIGQSVATRGSGMTVTEFNGDGIPDIVTGLWSRDDDDPKWVRVALGVGDGSFAEPLQFTVDLPWMFEAADLNGDGLADLYGNSMGSWPNRVVVLMNDGNWPTPGLPPVLASVGDVSVAEGNVGTVSATFTVTLSTASDQTVTVDYATADGTASESDYTAASGTLTFAPGETTKTITVLVKGDRLHEPNETFVVYLSNATNATLTDGQAVGTILDDEPRVSISDERMAEGKKGKAIFTFTVSLLMAYDQPVTMSFQTVNHSATTGNKDFVAKSGKITFAPGETTKTITIEVQGDNKLEPDELFFLDLFGLSSNALFTKNRGIGTILNDD